eukprot:Pgem_evm2s18256
MSADDNRKLRDLLEKLEPRIKYMKDHNYVSQNNPYFKISTEKNLPIKTIFDANDNSFDSFLHANDYLCNAYTLQK